MELFIRGISIGTLGSILLVKACFPELYIILDFQLHRTRFIVQASISYEWINANEIIPRCQQNGDLYDRWLYHGNP